MRELSRRMDMVSTVLFVADLIAVMCVYYFGGVATMPFADLPLLYWVLLFLLPAIPLVSALVWGVRPRFKSTKQQSTFAFAMSIIAGIVQIGVGLLINYLHPTGGFTALLFALGLLSFVTAYITYKGSALLK